MPCYHPLKGWRAREVNPSGKRSIVFKESDGYSDSPVVVPCGKCIGCRLAFARNWALRISHEASCYNDNTFITLTFNDEFLNKNKSLDDRDFVLFMKRLRKWCYGAECRKNYSFLYARQIRFFHCGEYGDKNERPHHHAIIFNFKFPDCVRADVSNRLPLYSSEILQSLWVDPKTNKSLGYTVIGEVTDATAAYVGGYVTKKVRASKDSEDVTGKKRPYISMSRRPGVGYYWLEEFGSDVYNGDKVIKKGGFAFRPPKYYDSQFCLTDEDSFDRIKKVRVHRAILAKSDVDNSRLMLANRERADEERVAQLRREL